MIWHELNCENRQARENIELYFQIDIVECNVYKSKNLMSVTKFADRKCSLSDLTLVILEVHRHAQRLALLEKFCGCYGKPEKDSMESLRQRSEPSFADTIAVE